MRRYGYGMAMAVALLYTFIGWLWIFLSDRYLVSFYKDPQNWLKFQTYKGLAFVLFSGALLYLLLKAYIAPRQEVENAYQELIEHSLQGFFVIQDNRIVLTNQATTEMIGYTAHELYAMTARQSLRLIHSDDRPLLLQNIKRLVRGEIDTCTQELRFISKDGRMLWLMVSLIAASYKGRQAIQTTCLDISNRKTIDYALQRKDRILEAVSFAAEQFLRAGTWTEVIQDVLKRLAEAADASRVYIFKKHNTGNGRLLSSLVYEWVAPGILPQTDNPDLQRFDLAGAGFRRWIDLFSQHKSVYGLVRDFPTEEQGLLVAWSIKSLLWVPIYAGNDLWGILGFDDCLNERIWSTSDVNALETAANILGSVINQKQTEMAIERQLRELVVLHNVSLAQTQANTIGELVRQVTEIIGEALYTDNFGILLLEPDGETLCQHVSYHGIPSTIAPSRFPITQGITGRVARTGKALRIGDVRTFPDYWEIIPGIRSELCVPIKIGDRVLGVINAESRELEAFSAEDERLLSTIASGLATSIEKIRLFESETMRRREAEMQSRVAAAVSSSLDLATVLDTILESIKQVIPYDSASIFLAEGGKVKVVAHKGFSVTNSFLVKKPARRSKLLDRIKKSRQALLIKDLSTVKNFDQWSSGPQIHGWLGVPLIARDEVIGFMTLDSHSSGTFTESHKSFAQAIAYHAASAISNAKSFDIEQRRRREAEVLRRASELVSSSLDLREVLGNLLFALKEAIPYDSATVFLIEGNEVRIMACHSANREQDGIIGKTFPLENPLFQEVKKQGKPIVLDDCQRDTRFWRWGGTDYVHGWMGIPLIVRGTVIGFITLDSRKKAAFDQESANLAQAVAHQAAAAIQNATLYQQAVQAAERRLILHRLSQDINLASLSTEETYASIHKAVRELMACDAFLIALYDEVQDEHEIVYLYEGAQRFGPVRLKAGQGMTGQVIQRNETLLWGDVEEKNENIFHFGSPQKVHSVLAVPLRIRNKVIGALSTQSYRRNAYGEEERVLLETLANNAAIAIENSRLFQEIQGRLGDLEALVRASKVLGQTLELIPLLQNILRSACEAIPAAEKGSISLLEDGENLRIYATYGYTDERVLDERFGKEEGYGMLAVRERRPLLIEDAHSKDIPPYIGNIEAIAQIQSAIVAPLISKERIIGVISLDNASRTSAFTEDNLRLLVTLAAPAALAIENARLFSEIRQRLDELVAVNLISSVLRNAQTVEDMLPAVLDETLQILELQVGAIWLFDEINGQLYQAEARGWFEQIPVKRLRMGEGIVGHAFKASEVYISEDLSSDELVQVENRQYVPSGWSGICIPIRSAGEAIGVYLFAVRHPRKLKDDELRLLTTFADMVGSALHRTSLYQRIERQVQRLTALRDVDTAITSSFDLRVTLTILIDNAISHLNVDAVAVLLYNPTSQMLTYAAGRGFHTLGITRSMLRIGEGLAGRAALERRLISEPDLVHSNLFRRRDLLAGENFVCYYGVSLVAKGQVKGVLEIFHRSPLTPTADWLEFLQTIAGQAAIAIDNTQMFDNLQRTNQELVMAYDTTLEGWSKALELRDQETEGHSQRVTELTLALARRMGVPPAELVHIRRGVLLHDIGKMGIPDHILRKAGPLTSEEWEYMRRHPQMAYDLLSPIAYLRPALDIPYCHHEMWNGKGYPRGLKGEEIPLAARIFSVVDVWDALAYDRPYRPAWPKQKIIRYIQSQAGKRFDPMVVDIFLEMIREEEQNQ